VCRRGLIGVVVALAAAATLFALRGPVLLSISPDPAMLRPRNFCLMNPFRDRSPERAADSFLEQLKAGHVAVLTPAVTGPSRKAQTIESETRWPITAWRIGRREDSDEAVEIMYWVKRGNGYSRDGLEEEAYVTVDRRNSRVTRFEAIY